MFISEIKTITSKSDSKDWINGICEKCFAESDGFKSFKGTGAIAVYGAFCLDWNRFWANLGR